MLLFGCIRRCNWSLPDKAIDEQLARSLVQIAKILAPEEGAGALTSEAELELWVKHMSPVWKGEMATMKAALLACYAEATELNILRESAMPIGLPFRRCRAHS